MFICNFHPDHKKCLFDGTRIASYCTTGKREVLQCRHFVMPSNENDRQT